MKTLSFLLVALALPGLVQQQRSTQSRVAPAAQAQSAETSPFELLYARPFVLDEPYLHTWRKEAPAVSSGYLLVLRAERELIRPVQVLEPVLYVGAQTAERVNAPAQEGSDTAQLVVVVPAPLDDGTDGDGQVALDPVRVPIFLGTKALPEDVDAASIQRELRRATALRLGPARLPQVAGLAGLRRPKTVLRLPSRADLDLELANLIAFYSPEERDLVQSLRVPETKR